MKDHPSQWIASGLTCREVAGLTSEYLDDAPSLPIKFRVGLHLASCAHCRAYVNQIILIRDTVARSRRPVPSPFNRLRLRRHFARCYAPSK
ncbi:MAG: hypothetical protein GDA67_13745 [Nitrospira sp. CR1.3]|nr:hypothetical protein [Nitrospira sp. CR1.3]